MDATESKTAHPLTWTVRHTCRGCQAPQLKDVLDLGVQYLPRFVKEKDESLPKAPLQLVRCANCELLQLKHTVNPDLLYREFWYRSSINQTMKQALWDVVREGTLTHGEGTWLDIGANDGFLLSKVPESFKKIAVEPAYNFQTLLEEHSDLVYSDYFSEELEVEPCDVITSVAMFYDVEDPMPFLRTIAKTLTDDGIWINQLNDSPTMLKQNAFDAICHEHLLYYDVHNLNRMYEEAGLRIVSVSYNDVNGGSVRIVAKKGKPSNDGFLLGIPKPSLGAANGFRQRIEKWKHRMTQLIAESMVLKGPIWAYGASTKGTVLLQYLDLPEAFFAVADRNPQKVGLTMAGTWIPIVDEITMRKAPPRYLFVLPWAFKNEFVLREEQIRSSGTTMVFPLPNPEFVL